MAGREAQESVVKRQFKGCLWCRFWTKEREDGSMWWRICHASEANPRYKNVVQLKSTSLVTVLTNSMYSCGFFDERTASSKRGVVAGSVSDEVHEKAENPRFTNNYDRRAKDLQRWRAVTDEVASMQQELDEQPAKLVLFKLLLSHLASVLNSGVGNTSREDLCIRISESYANRYAAGMVVDIRRDINQTFAAARGADAETLLPQLQQRVRQVFLRSEKLASEMMLRLGEELRELDRDREKLPDRNPQ
jgi:hypothetical protein